MINTKIVAIDLGDKRVGVATLVAGISFPKKIVPRVEIISYLKKLQRDYDFSEIVVGLPYDLHGKHMRQLDKTKKFIDKLENIFPNKKIIGVDERYSTFEAQQGSTAKHIDDVAASLILESYVCRKK